MSRKHTALLLASLLTVSTAAAHAEAPTSQFGFTGWPYRQSVCEETFAPATATPAPTTESTPFPTPTPAYDTNEGETGQNQPVSPTKEPSAATLQPTAAPTAIVTPTPTARPTVIPTVKPTEKPAVTQTPSMDDDYNTNSLSAQEQIAFNLLNQDRKANGLSPLTLDPVLSELARIKSNDMRDNHYFAHESPTYGSVSNMLKTFGYSFSAAGENIAHHATVDKAQAAFMSSSGHRKNILSTSWSKVGIGISHDAQGYVYLTQIFVR